MKVFKYHTDPAHGWVAVKYEMLEQLNIAHKISAFSYESNTGKTIYLEEDRDAPIFTKAYEAKFGQTPILFNVHTNYRSKIRQYASYLRGKKHWED